MTLNYSLIGKRIKAARKAKGLSQSELSEMIDKSTGYMSYIETGSKKPSLETLILIANAVDVTVDELLSDSLLMVPSIPNMQIKRLLDDCNPYEKRIIIGSAHAIKDALRTSKYLLEVNPDINYKKN